MARVTCEVQLKNFAGRKSDDAEAWLDDLQEAKELYGWSVEDSLKIARLHLRGEARDWVKLNSFGTWSAFVEGFSARFMDTTGDLPSLLIRLQNRVQTPGETVGNYAVALRKIAKDARDPSFAKATLLHFFLKGLEPAMRWHVMLARPQTLSEAVEAGEYRERYMALLDDAPQAPARDATTSPVEKGGGAKFNPGDGVVSGEGSSEGVADAVENLAREVAQLRKTVDWLGGAAAGAFFHTVA